MSKQRFQRAILALIFWTFLVANVSAADPKKGEKPPGFEAINKLAWLAGIWRMERNGRVVEEQWMAPAAGTMFGVSRTISKGRVLEHEFMQIREGPGGIFFIAQPSGQKEAAFQMTTLSDTEIVFENLQHDFPQRVIYAFQPNGSLLAAIEGTASDGKIRRIEFLYKRP